MKHYKISKLLNDSPVSKFVTRKWIETKDSSSIQHPFNKNIRFKTSMFICDYVILVMHMLFYFESVRGIENANKRNLQ